MRLCFLKRIRWRQKKKKQITCYMNNTMHVLSWIFSFLRYVWTFHSFIHTLFKEEDVHIYMCILASQVVFYSIEPNKLIVHISTNSQQMKQHEHSHESTKQKALHFGNIQGEISFILKMRAYNHLKLKTWYLKLRQKLPYGILVNVLCIRDFNH